jgi:uncharacterized membrane protein
MTSVVVERLMKGVHADRVWEIASNLTAYPKFMDQVMSVELLNLPAGAHGTSWTVLFNGNELRWDEIDSFEPTQRRMTFEQIDGDLAQWRGSFVAVERNGGVAARYEVEFDLGIPALAHVLHPLGETAIRSNCEQMLQEIEVRSLALGVADAPV